MKTFFHFMWIYISLKGFLKVFNFYGNFYSLIHWMSVRLNQKGFMLVVFDQILLTGHELFLKTNELSDSNGIRTHNYLDRK